MAKSNGEIILLQNRLFLDCSLTRAQRRFTMKRLMGWSHHSGRLMPLLAPQLLLPVLRSKARKWNLSQTLRNQNLCRTVQNPAQLQRSVWGACAFSRKGINALLQTPVMLHLFPPGCLKKMGGKQEKSCRKKLERPWMSHLSLI